MMEKQRNSRRVANLLSRTFYVLILTGVITSCLQINISRADTVGYSYEEDKRIAQKVKKSYQIELDVPIEDVIQQLTVTGQDLQIGTTEAENIRKATVELLGRIQGTQQIPVIEKLLLEDTSALVRTQCAKALQSLESVNSKQVLLEALKDNDQEVRLWSALALASIKEKQSSFTVLKNLWNTGDDRMKRFCHLGFRELATMDALDMLHHATNHKEPYVAVDAAIVLSQLGYKSDAFEIFQELLYHKEKYVRMAVLRGLSYIGDEESLMLIQDLLKDEEYLVQQRSQEILVRYGKVIPTEKSLSAKVSTRYNPDAAVQYSERWWNDKHPAYDFYGPDVDCANFVSQCLKAGGLELSKGTNGRGYGVKEYGVIPFCDDLHTHLVTYQDVRYERKNRYAEPDWMTKGDVAIFGGSSDRWQHAVFAVTNVVEYNAHTTNRQHMKASHFYSQWSSADFYHINNRICNTSDPYLLVGCDKNGKYTPVFYEAYAATGGRDKLGLPDTAPGQNPYVHPWGSFTIQDFDGGQYGDSAIIQSPDPNYAFLLRHAFWQTFKNLPGESREYCLGKPLNDEYPANGGNPQGGSKVTAIQDFKYGHLEYTPFGSGCSQPWGCVELYTTRSLFPPCSPFPYTFKQQRYGYTPAAPMCVAGIGKGVGCREPLPVPNPIPNPSGCSCSNIMNCQIPSGKNLNCSGYGSITLVPGFHAQQGSSVTLQP